MSFYSNEELFNLGFKFVGKNVKVSKKCSIYNHDQISINDNSRIDDFCILSGKISIGKNVHIACYTNIAGGELGVEFHDFSGAAYRVTVMSQSDDYSGQSLTNPTIPEKFKNVYRAKTIIGKHVILGTGTIVLPGVEIAEGCSTGAMTLINKNTEPWTIYVGSPMQAIKKRKNDLLKLEQEYLFESRQNE